MAQRVRRMRAWIQRMMKKNNLHEPKQRVTREGKETNLGGKKEENKKSCSRIIQCSAFINIYDFVLDSITALFLRL